jgi:hypothetical protein
VTRKITVPAVTAMVTKNMICALILELNRTDQSFNLKIRRRERDKCNDSRRTMPMEITIKCKWIDGVDIYIVLDIGI